MSALFLRDEHTNLLSLQYVAEGGPQIALFGSVGYIHKCMCVCLLGSVIYTYMSALYFRDEHAILF